jgi:hypothetical protein
MLDELDELLDVCGTSAAGLVVLTRIPHRGAPFPYLPMMTRLGVDCGVAGVRWADGVLLVDRWGWSWATAGAGDRGGWMGNESGS